MPATTRSLYSSASAVAPPPRSAAQSAGVTLSCASAAHRLHALSPPHLVRVRVRVKVRVRVRVRVRVKVRVRVLHLREVRGGLRERLGAPAVAVVGLLAW